MVSRGTQLGFACHLEEPLRNKVGVGYVQDDVVLQHAHSYLALTTKELLEEATRTRTRNEDGADAALSILHVIYEGVDLQSLQYVWIVTLTCMY